MSLQALLALAAAAASAAWFLRDTVRAFQPADDACQSGCGGCAARCPFAQTGTPSRTR